MPSGLRRPALIVVAAAAHSPDVFRHAVAVGAEHVAVLPEADEWLCDRVTEALRTPRGRPAVVLGIIGGRGGAGASTLAAGLAVTAARRGQDVTLVDADPFGGGMDLLLGMEDAPGPRWSQLREARGRVPATLTAALPRAAGVRVLSWDRDGGMHLPAEAVTSVLDAVARSSDLVVVDLPRATDPATEVLLGRLHLGVLVVPAQVRSVAAALQVAAVYTARLPRCRLVVRGPAPGGLAGPAVAEAVGVPYAGWLPHDPRLAHLAECGEPPGTRPRTGFGRFCSRLLDDVLAACRAPAT
jgi:secretion/DNA translocation related CpaE-like protein